MTQINKQFIKVNNHRLPIILILIKYYFDICIVIKIYIYI